MIDAVFIKRYVSQECPHCEQPVCVVNDLELGTIVRVDLTSKCLRPLVSHGQTYQIESVQQSDGTWFPAELLKHEGRSL